MRVKLLKELFITLKMSFLLIKHQNITLKRYKNAINMVDMFNKYREYQFIMPNAKSIYDELCNELRLLKGEMSSG